MVYPARVSHQKVHTHFKLSPFTSVSIKEDPHLDILSVRERTMGLLPNLREQAPHSCKAHVVSPLDERKLPLPSWVAQPRAQVMLNLRLHFLKLTVGTETAHFGPVWKNLLPSAPITSPEMA